MTTKHTPTPWKTRGYEADDGDVWIDCDSWVNRKTASCRGGTVARTLSTGGPARANADFIVKAVNAHDGLTTEVATLRAQLQTARSDALEEARRIFDNWTRDGFDVRKETLRNGVFQALDRALSHPSGKGDGGETK